MVEIVNIINPMDRAIIKSFNVSKSGILKKETIIKYVASSIRASEAAIAKRIETLCNDKKYLIRPKRGDYRINPDYNFEFPEGRMTAAIAFFRIE